MDHLKNAPRPREETPIALLRRGVIALLVCWTLLIVLSLAWNIARTYKETRETTLHVARAYFQKDLAFRLWGARHGGVYVPVDDDTRPNPYLSHVPERDIVTPSGKRLTLMNPAYMMRQMMATFAELTGVSGHLTSTKLLNPINVPDPWERKALERLAQGEEEVVEFTSEGGRPYLRLMRPFVTKRPCLKCHAIQGYKEGDLRGGITIRLPLAPYYAIARRSLIILAITHLLLWLAGLGGIFLGARYVRQHIKRRLAMEKDLREQHEFTRTIIESLTHPFYVFDARSHAILLANQAALQGRNPAEHTCYSLSHQRSTPCDGKEHPCPLQRVKEEKRTVTVEHIHYTADGAPRNMEIQCYPVFDANGTVDKVIEYAIDITERVQEQRAREELQRQLHRAQRLEAIGLLAGGVAHDFNNLLTTIIGYSELALMQLPPQDPCREAVAAINEAGERAAALTRQLLAFSRKQVMHLRPLDLNELICNLVKLLKRLLGEDIELELQLAEGLAPIMADESQVEQVLMNLAVNARDAMPDGGKLVFATTAVTISEQDAEQEGLAPGGYARLRVSDTGMGMEPEILDKIFEPFFTTKEKDRGTGLGLATIYGIMQQHGGQIHVASEPGRGTTFTLYFPLAQSGTVREERERKEARPTGSETILAVDDEPSILKLLDASLSPLGYQVLTAVSAAEALAILKNNEPEVDLLLTDVILPDLNGKQLADQARRLQPTIAVLYISGYTDTIITTKGILPREIHLLHKPIVPHVLAKKVREVLDEARSSSRPLSPS